MRTKNQRQINKATDLKQHNPKKLEKKGGPKTLKIKRKAKKIIPEIRTLTTNPEISSSSDKWLSDVE